MRTKASELSAPRRSPAPGESLNRQHVAAMLGFTDARATDRAMAKHPDFPRPFHPFSRSPRWRRVDVQDWINRHAQAAQERGAA